MQNVKCKSENIPPKRYKSAPIESYANSRIAEIAEIHSTIKMLSSHDEAQRAQFVVTIDTLHSRRSALSRPARADVHDADALLTHRRTRRRQCCVRAPPSSWWTSDVRRRSPRDERVGCCATTGAVSRRRWHRWRETITREARSHGGSQDAQEFGVNYSPIGAPHRTERRRIKLQDTYNTFNGPGIADDFQKTRAVLPARAPRDTVARLICLRVSVCRQGSPIKS